MKIHEYNEMMAHLTRRRLMSRGGRPSLADQEKFYEDILKAYNKLKKELGRNPTQGELLRATGRKSQTAIRTAEKKFGLKFFNKPGEYNVPREVLQKIRKKQAEEAQAKKIITQPTTFQEEGVLKKVRFPNKKMEDAFKANVKLYYSFPQGSSEAKKAGATLDSFKNFYPDGVSDEVLRRHVYFYKDKLNLKFPKQEYEGQLKTQKIVNKRRENLIKEVSGFLQERQIGKAKRETGFGRAGENLDLAHRASLKQFKDFGLPYLTDNLGLDTKKLNQEILPPLEKEVNSLHRQRMKLIKGVEPGNVPKEVSKKLEDINIKLSNISMKTNGALQAVLLDEKTLKPFVFNKNYANVIGQGLIDKPVKDLSKADIDFIKSTFPQAAKTAKQGGTTLGSTMIQPELANIDTPAARNLFSSAGKIALGELGFAGPSVVLDTYAGLTPSEMALNVATFGFGTPLKDSVEKRKYIADAGFGSDYSTALQKRRILKTAPKSSIGELTEREKQAMFLSNAFDAGLDLKRAEQAEKYKQRQQSQLKRGELEIPDYTEVPEATTSIQPEFQEETTETKSLPFGLDRLLPFDDDEII